MCFSGDDADAFAPGNVVLSGDESQLESFFGTHDLCPGAPTELYRERLNAFFEIFSEDLAAIFLFDTEVGRRRAASDFDVCGAWLEPDDEFLAFAAGIVAKGGACAIGASIGIAWLLEDGIVWIVWDDDIPVAAVCVLPLEYDVPCQVRSESVRDVAKAGAGVFFADGVVVDEQFAPGAAADAEQPFGAGCGGFLWDVDAAFEGVAHPW